MDRSNPGKWFEDFYGNYLILLIKSCLRSNQELTLSLLTQKELGKDDIEFEIPQNTAFSESKNQFLPLLSSPLDSSSLKFSFLLLLFFFLKIPSL